MAGFWDKYGGAIVGVAGAAAAPWTGGASLAVGTAYAQQHAAQQRAEAARRQGVTRTYGAGGIPHTTFGGAGSPGPMMPGVQLASYTPPAAVTPMLPAAVGGGLIPVAVEVIQRARPVIHAIVSGLTDAAVRALARRLKASARDVGETLANINVADLHMGDQNVIVQLSASDKMRISNEAERILRRRRRRGGVPKTVKRWFRAFSEMRKYATTACRPMYSGYRKGKK